MKRARAHGAAAGSYARCETCLGFRAHGLGVIVKVNAKSVQVQLLESVTLSARKVGADWPAGRILTGIPRFSFANIDRWNAEHCVELVNAEA